MRPNNWSSSLIHVIVHPNINNKSEVFVKEGSREERVIKTKFEKWVLPRFLIGLMRISHKLP